MKKYIFLIFLLSINLGNILDITQEPNQKDIIICLGGGWYDRIDKGIELYNMGYSKSNKIMFTSRELFNAKSIKFNKRIRMINQGIENQNILHVSEKKVKNTYDELKEIKLFLINNNLKTALVVSQPSHSLRIKIIAYYLLDYKKEGLSLITVSSSNRNWDKSFFYQDLKTLKTTYLEILKIIYNVIKYKLFKID